MERNRIVLDTNCLIASLSRKGKYFPVWRGLQEGRYILCVSNEIVNEYQEIIGRKANAFIAENVIQFLVNCQFVEVYEPTFHFNIIQSDPDDNKFVDCAIVANALCIVSNDKHFRELEHVQYPHVDVLTIQQFLEWLKR